MMQLLLDMVIQKQLNASGYVHVSAGAYSISSLQEEAAEFDFADFEISKKDPTLLFFIDDFDFVVYDGREPQQIRFLCPLEWVFSSRYHLSRRE